MGKYLEYNQEGLKAFLRYASEEFSEVVDEVEAKNRHAYFDKALFQNLKDKTETFISEIQEGNEVGLLKILNKNPIFDFFLGVVGEEVFRNQEKINNFFRDVKDKGGKSLYEAGYDESLFLRAISQSQTNGLFGERSGAKLLADKIIGDLPYIVDIALLNNPDVIKAKIFAEFIGITPESLKEVYQQQGFTKPGGLLEHITSGFKSPQGRQILELGKLELQEYIKKKGKEVDLSALDLDELSTAYKLYGFNGKEGLVNIITTSILGHQKGLGGRIFSEYTEGFAKENVEAVKNAFENEFGYKESEVEMLIENLVSDFLVKTMGGAMDKNETREILGDLSKTDKIKKLVGFAKKNPPLVLQDNHLLPHIMKYGVLGEEGVFAYLEEAIPEIMAPFARVGLTKQEEINEMQKRYKEISEITEAGELWVALDHLILTRVKNKKGSWTVDLAQRAENLRISPYELLTSEEFSDERKDWFEKHFYYRENIKAILQRTNSEIERLVFSQDIIKNIEDTLKRRKDKTELLKSFISYLKFQTGRDPDYPKKIGDYLRLAKDLSSSIAKRLNNIF